MQLTTRLLLLVAVLGRLGSLQELFGIPSVVFLEFLGEVSQLLGMNGRVGMRYRNIFSR